MAVVDALSSLFLRDLGKVADEIKAYKVEANIWRTDGQVTNSAGSLALHICGNLKHFIGALLGNTGYVREREKEFNLKGLSQTELLTLLTETEEVVANTLKKLTDAQLGEDYPIEKNGNQWQNDKFLLHLLAHLNYHLGQINYHRRLIEKA